MKKIKFLFMYLAALVPQLVLAQESFVTSEVENVSNDWVVTFSGEPTWYRFIAINPDDLDIKVYAPGMKHDCLAIGSVDFSNTNDSAIFAVIQWHLTGRNENLWLVSKNDNHIICSFYNEVRLGYGREYELYPALLNDPAQNPFTKVAKYIDNEFASKVRKDDYYKFDEYGNLSEFRYTYSDGVILEYKKYYIDGLSTYTYNDGLKITSYRDAITPYQTLYGSKKNWNSDSYECLANSGISSAPERERFRAYTTLGFELPNGVKLQRYEVKGDTLRTTDWIGQDTNGDIFFHEWNKRNSAGKRVWNYGYKHITFQNCIYEEVCKIEDGEYIDRILYPDGTFFEGLVNLIHSDNGSQTPDICSQEVADLINRMEVGKNDYIVYKPLYGVTPSKGKLYNAKGELFRIYEGPTLWYDANSDGNVTEVYEDGKAMQPGFARDRKILEYNGALKAKSDKLKEAELAAKKDAEKFEKVQAEQAKLSTKYGKGNVEKVLKEQIPISADIGIFEAVSRLGIGSDGTHTFKCHATLVSEYGNNYKTYKVQFSYYENSDGLSVLGHSYYVWTNGGKITSSTLID